LFANWLARHTLVYDVHPVIAASGWKAITLAGDELAFRAVLGICRSGAVPLSGCYYHFLLPNVSDVRAVRFAAMSHKVQGVAEWSGPCQASTQPQDAPDRMGGDNGSGPILSGISGQIDG
jgi:hypothetical protein